MPPTKSARVRIVAADVRLLEALDLARGGELRRAVDLEARAVGGVADVAHPRGGGDQLEVELPLEPRLDDLHVEQPQEAAAEAEAERRELSGSKVNEASFRRSFSTASRRPS
jgi:hypothetical protein